MEGRRPAKSPEGHVFRQASLSQKLSFLISNGALCLFYTLYAIRNTLYEIKALFCIIKTKVLNIFLPREIAKRYLTGECIND